jgi:hypothetical protein
MLFKLHTNEGTRYVRSTHKRLRAAMWEYIRAKRANGTPLAGIVFAWSPITVGRV